ncbi:MAG: T9SS type A sorting domain-containing protein [Bacteroidota bacterium]|nr:T9SS type A sorting domain-containing protein [Bacteroidota bacterium]
MKNFLTCLLILFALKALPQQSLSQTLGAGSASNCLCSGDLWNVSDQLKPNVTFSAAGYSHRVLFTNYGFTIPTNCTVTGVQVSFNYTSNVSNATLRDTIVMLLVGGYLAGYTQAAATPDYMGNNSVSIGSSIDMWGTYLTYNEINHPGFGFNFKLVSSVAGNKMGFTNGATITVFYDLASGIKESQSMRSKTKLYTDKKSVKISSDLAQNSEVSIYNILGTKLITVHLDANSNKELDLSNLSEGMYVYTIKSEGKERSGKFILE